MDWLTGVLEWAFRPHLLTLVFWATWGVSAVFYKWDYHMVQAGGYYSQWERRANGLGRSLSYGLWTALVAWVAAFILVAVVGAFSTSTSESWESRDQPMVAMRTADVATGTFFIFLGTGSGKTSYEATYVYYVQESDGAIVQRHLSGDGIRIYEEDRTDGVQRTWWHRRDSDVSGWAHKYIFVVESGPFWTQGSKEFRVPRGSVKREIVIR